MSPLCSFREALPPMMTWHLTHTLFLSHIWVFSFQLTRTHAHNTILFGPSSWLETLSFLWQLRLEITDTVGLGNLLSVDTADLLEWDNDMQSNESQAVTKARLTAYRCRLRYLPDAASVFVPGWGCHRTSGRSFNYYQLIRVVMCLIMEQKVLDGPLFDLREETSTVRVQW